MTQPQPLVRPIFRVVGERAYFAGRSYSKGQTFSPNEWPKAEQGDIAPVNEEAKRIVAYFKAYRYHRFFSSLVSPDGDIYLPANLGYYAQNLPPPEAAPTADMPRYRIDGAVKLGDVLQERGAIVAYIGWPTFSMSPVNAVAERIAKYLARHCGDPHLPHQPWCDYRAGPYLPSLSAADDDLPLAPQTAPHVARSTQQRYRRAGARPRVTA